MDIQTVGSGQNPTLQGLEKTNSALQKILQRLSTAQRINSAADDAAGLGIAEQLQTQYRGFNMATQNVTDAMSALNIGGGAAGQITDLLQRNRDLAVQASSDTLNPQERADINTEFQGNLQEVDRIANATQFNGQNLINGTGLGAGTAQIQTGPNPGEAMQLPAINLGVNPLGLGGANVLTGAGARNAITGIDNALNLVNTAQSTIGATTNQLQYSLNNLSTANINTQAAASDLVDEDMATGIVDLTQQRLMQETGIYAFSRFNQISANNIMTLLQ